MNTKQSLLVASTAAIIGLATIGTGITLAAAPAKSTIVDKLAERFNLNRDDVQKVFEEHRQETQIERQQKLKDRLDQAVKDGKLTQVQEDAILAKVQEVEAFMATLKDKTPTEREAAIKTEMDSVKQWVKDNNIPEQYVMPFKGGMRRGGQPGGPSHVKGSHNSQEKAS
jgi:hypothetical protein